MNEKWKNDLVALLKHLEKSCFNNRDIHEFRRSVESTHAKKVDRLLPQLNMIWDQCKDHLNDPNFVEWINHQHFQLKLGLKVISLVDDKQPHEFEQHFRWVLSEFDSTLDQRLPEDTIKSGGLPISARKMKMAMRHMQGLDEQTISNMMERFLQVNLKQCRRIKIQSR